MRADLSACLLFLATLSAVTAAVDEGGVEIPNPFPLDRREPVTNLKEFPYSAIGYFYLSGCTGALISPRHVLTAAHCINSSETRREAFAPAFSSHVEEWRDQAYNFSWVERTRVAVDYENDTALADYALITLEKNIGSPNTTGYFRPVPQAAASRSPVFLEGHVVYTAGYPEDKGSGDMWRQNCTDDGVPSNETDGILNLDCWVFYGQSGSPIWSGVNITGEGPSLRKAADLVAVVSRGDYNSTDNVLVDEDVVSVLREWMQEDYDDKYGGSLARHLRSGLSSAAEGAREMAQTVLQDFAHDLTKVFQGFGRKLLSKSAK